MTDLEGCLGLHLIPRLGPIRFQRLLARFGTVQAILAASAAQLQAVEGIDGELAAAIIAIPQRVARPHEELAKVQAMGGHCLPWTDGLYPAGLRTLADPPPVLYLRGTLTPADAPAVALVGTRRPTPYGVRIATQLSAALAERRITTVSGLARGIDGAVHRGSLQGGGRTIAVLGHGLDYCYPVEHRALADQIAQQGAIVTEFPVGTAVDRSLFPRRNRIIAGLSVGIVVVEADLHSGALITARWALEQGREVFAVPGPVGSPTSRGAHQLLKWGAKLVESVEDILEEVPALATLPAPPPHLAPRQEREAGVRGEPSSRIPLTATEGQVFTHLSVDPLPLEALQQATHLRWGTLAEVLLALQMKGLAHALPGQRYVRSYG